LGRLAPNLARIPIKIIEAPPSKKIVVAASDTDIARGQKRTTLSGIAANELACASEVPINNAPVNANIVTESFVRNDFTVCSIFRRLAGSNSASVPLHIFCLQKTRPMQPITERVLYPPNNGAKLAEH
jgi:hypothetical protein